MTEWWTYGLSDFLMFSSGVWHRMFELHNRAWWPLQPVCMVIGVGLLWTINRRFRIALRLGLIMMGLAHLFVAWSFLWQRYADINLVAHYFALAFAVQGVALIGFALRHRDIVIRHGNWAAWVGAGMLGFAVMLYPVLLLFWGRPMEQSEWFAVAPDPTVLATLGVLLLVSRCAELPRPRRSWALLAAWPLLWCAITGLTLWMLDAPVWWLMPVLGALSAVVAWWQGGRRRLRHRLYPGRL